MYFAIQVSNPKVLQPNDKEFNDFAELIEAIFPMQTEDVFLIWNWVPVRLNYKYDLSVMIEDLIPLLAKLIDSDSGSHRVYWGSNTFRAEWIIDWANGQLNIASQWDSIAGNYEELLNSRSKLEISQDLFLREWKALLRKIVELIDNMNIIVTDTDNLNNLIKIENSIPLFSKRYSQ
ncbi:MAG: hypothetical protein RMX68_026880 [Aulosira sp. ZfuVER01]|nr:hypothetical protein [Aulosira sp. ZfuVER01]MDZ8000177.1 hypothetical protein [Aulosira sp. DedVER01a]MDZ8055685.1 hypothetical protein [Aulosira sp. ZfuCHP01]